MDIQLLGYANSISAIVQDVVLVVLPMSYLRKLQMKRSRKLAVGVMFLIGSLYVPNPQHLHNTASTVFILTLSSGCVTTIIRLRTLLIFKISFDPTWDYVPIVIWTELEITAAFACVSLPAIRVLLVKITPKRFKGWLSDVTHSSSHQTPNNAIMPREASSKRDWHKDDTWINLKSTELADERMSREKIGFLPSAETSSTNSFKAEEGKSKYAVPASDQMSDEVHLADLSKPLPRGPVSVRSKFSN